MAWIESHQTLDKNGKLLELSNKLGINKYQAIGHLHALWWWAIDNAENGNLKRFSNATVTQACGWTEYIKDEMEISRINEITNREKGDSFVDELINCGFLDRRDGGLFIHNWELYTHRYFASVTKSSRKKEMTRERVARFRRSNATVTQEKHTVTPPTIPNHTIPNQLEDKDIVRKRTSFVKPSIQEITAYCRERRNRVDPQGFLDFYESKGWVVGRSPMKDWKAAVRTWEKNNVGFQSINPAHQPPMLIDPVKMAEAQARSEELREREWQKKEAARSGAK